MLLPDDRADRTFRDYHRGHRQAAATQDDDAPRFQIPEAGDPYPRSSLPALEGATWVREAHPDRFRVFAMALFEAFFGGNEDISDLAVLGRVAEQCEMSAAALSEVIREQRYRGRVLAEHQEALGLGIRGIPAVVVPGRPPIVGAAPYFDLRGAVEAALQAAADARGSAAGTSPERGTR